MLKSNDLLISTTNAKPPKPRSIRLVNQTSKDRGENKVELCARSRGSNGKSLLPRKPATFFAIRNSARPVSNVASLSEEWQTERPAGDETLLRTRRSNE